MRSPTVRAVRCASKAVAPSAVSSQYCSMCQMNNALYLSGRRTPRGVLSDRQCREQKVGGELLCTVE
ncbi:MAG: 30S ribosomal protein S8 [Phycisphaeraceae bacterium]